VTDRIRVVLATHNAHKVEEFQRMLGTASAAVEVVSYDGPEPVEDGVSFTENALIKARAAAEHTGLPALDDDSGVCVDVLGGAPGIFSARWAGHHGDAQANLELLLDQLSDVRPEHRGAHFRATIALVVPNGDGTYEQTVVDGIWPGRIAEHARGVNGFGYDPIFIPDGGDLTSAELSAAEKDADSHRARALNLILPAVRSLVDDRRSG
jgi:XTP/dITP diphosphohydrolase